MNKYDLVVIGGGSGGIAACVSAYDAGIKSILLLEREAYLGGILLQCIHNGFGLQTYKEELTGPEYAYRTSSELIKRNIAYKLSTTVTNISHDLEVTYTNSTEGYQVVKAKAIICATGCSERNRGAIIIPGDRPQGVMTAGQAQKYLNIDGYMVGKKVFILGSGDIGLIMARRMTLEGAKVLGVAEIMPYSNGLNRNIVQCLEDYDIPLYLSHTVSKIIGKEKISKIIISQVDDKLQYIEGTEKEFEVDALLLSIGLIPSNPLLENLGVEIHPKTKGPIVDESFQTSIPGIFACGNSLHVHDLVDFVSLEGQKAGISAAKYINGELKYSKGIKVINGNGVSYTMPSTINVNNIDVATINFRTTKPFKSCKIQIKDNETILKTIKKTYLVPSEMENIKIDKELLLNISSITVEVIDE